MKNLLFLFVIISCLSCTKEIYRGQVTHKESNSKKLIHLQGTNQAVWSDDPTLELEDVVKLETKNELKTFKITSIISPVLGHTHLASGAHSKIHIVELSFDDSLEYNGTNYTNIAVSMDHPTTQPLTTFGAWIDSDSTAVLQNMMEIYCVYLRDETSDIILIDGKRLILDYTTEEHAGH